MSKASQVSGFFLFFYSFICLAGGAEKSSYQKVRIFEHIKAHEDAGKTLRCRQGVFSSECSFIEIVVSQQEIAIHECRPDIKKLNYQVSPLEAVYANFSEDCEVLFTTSMSHSNAKDFLTEMETQLSKRDFERRDPAILLKTGVGTLLGATLTLASASLTILSFVQPLIPLWIVTGPGTIAAGSQTAHSLNDFFDEIYGSKRTLNLYPLTTFFSLSPKRSTETLVFVIPVTEDSFSRKSGMTSLMKPNDYELFAQGWRKLGKKLNKLQADVFRVDGSDLSELVPYPMP